MVQIRSDDAAVDPHSVGRVSARMATLVAPWKVGAALAALSALATAGATAAGIAPSWVPPGVPGALAGALAGFLLGLTGTWLRNAVMTVYLRYLWTRLNHHEASDILDRLS